MEHFSTGGILLRFDDPFNEKRFKEYIPYKKKVEKLLVLKKKFGINEQKTSKTTRESYGSGLETTADYNDAFIMFFAIRNRSRTKQDFLNWLRSMDSKFKGEYHDSLLEEWAGMLANGTMNEGILLNDITFDMMVLEGSNFGMKYTDLTFISSTIGLSLFDDCDCTNPSKHRKDCEQQKNLLTTLEYFSVAVKNLDPIFAFLAHEAEIDIVKESNAHFRDFLYPVTFISWNVLLEKGIKLSQLRSPTIEIRNGIIINYFCSIFEFGGEDEFIQRKKYDSIVLGLRDVEMELS